MLRCRVGNGLHCLESCETCPLCPHEVMDKQIRPKLIRVVTAAVNASARSSVWPRLGMASCRWVEATTICQQLFVNNLLVGWRAQAEPLNKYSEWQPVCNVPMPSHGTLASGALVLFRRLLWRHWSALMVNQAIAQIELCDFTFLYFHDRLWLAGGKVRLFCLPVQPAAQRQKHDPLCRQLEQASHHSPSFERAARSESVAGVRTKRTQVPTRRRTQQHNRHATHPYTAPSPTKSLCHRWARAPLSPISSVQLDGTYTCPPNAPTTFSYHSVNVSCLPYPIQLYSIAQVRGTFRTPHPTPHSSTSRSSPSPAPTPTPPAPPPPPPTACPYPYAEYAPS